MVNWVYGLIPEDYEGTKQLKTFRIDRAPSEAIPYFEKFASVPEATQEKPEIEIEVEKKKVKLPGRNRQGRCFVLHNDKWMGPNEYTLYIVWLEREERAPNIVAEFVQKYLPEGSKFKTKFVAVLKGHAIE